MDRDDILRLLAALSDPLRVEIVLLLGDHDELNVGEIVRQFNRSQPAISHHLKVLRDARLLKSEKRGQEVYYALDWQLASTSLRELVRMIEECPVAIRQRPDA